MATKLDRRKVESSEDAVERAYWIYDDRRQKRGHGESERDSFKWAIREAFPQWFTFLNDGRR